MQTLNMMMEMEKTQWCYHVTNYILCVITIGYSTSLIYCIPRQYKVEKKKNMQLM